MKFSFINARPNEPIHSTMAYASPPLGILYLASSLERTGIEVTALDQTSETSSVEKVVDWIIKEDPDVLGISVLINSSLIAPRIAEEVKKETGTGVEKKVENKPAAEKKEKKPSGTPATPEPATK